MSVAIYIIGGGASGLAAARCLEENGFASIILEATDRLGGRLRTDNYKGYNLDYGFQVLLTAYPSVRKYINFKELETVHFEPGALLFKDGKQSKIGDPLRKLSFLLPTIASPAGSLKDKYLVFKLSRELISQKTESIFKGSRKTTLAFLQEYGFSNRIIENFFKPFFTGIFLEDKLATPAEMFCFVYKMFSTGYAALPYGGIKDVAENLSKPLKNTTIKLSAKVLAIENNTIVLEDRSTLKADYIITAADISVINNSNQPTAVHWKSCTTLYFTTAKRYIKESIIGLVTDGNALINNICYPEPATADTAKGHLLSVTVVRQHNLADKELIAAVENELKIHCGIVTESFLKLYHIQKALPDLATLCYPEKPVKAGQHLYLAGDHLANGSLDAALLSGEVAAKAVIEAIGNN
ncbi:NAD(P)/FAD-dependent oxidoreductase [Flavobacterium sp.]|uniref:NAD(P)/FAD-dependent oxidoreductase n=1 Tax=Flavobacterium sp. TaxID=239 RepID=UPI00261DD79A|nr:NAD(P)/FAD-dependent oxidoreductase [Flavobacterium sp.]